MKQKRVFLAVDLGASGGRVLSGVFDGTDFQLEVIHRFPNGGIRAGDRLVWDWLALWQQIKQGLRIAGQKFAGDEIVSVGVDTWGVDFALVGEDDTVLGNPICYRDAQTVGILEQVFGVVSREEIFAQTGLQFLEFNSLFQLFAMQQRNSPALAAASRFLMMPDLFHWLLSGEYGNEATDASTSQLLDPRSGQWSTQLIEAFGLPQHLFQDLVAPGTLLGRLRKSVAEEVGLPQIQVIVPASHDTASAVAAVPVQSTASARPDWCYISSGTWSCVGVELPEPQVTDVVRQLDFTNEGGVNRTTRLLKNVAGLWLVQECRRIWALQGREFSWEQLVELAESSTRLKSFVPPDHAALLAPENMADSIVGVCRETNQPVPQSEGEIIRTALEGIALRYRMVIDRLEKITGGRIETIHIVGGGTQNRLLNQLAANATGRRVLTGPVEATATGNLVMQMIGAGDLGSIEQAREMLARTHQTHEYTPASSRDEWDQAYQRFQQFADD